MPDGQSRTRTGRASGSRCALRLDLLGRRERHLAHGPDGNVYDRIDPKNSFKWGLDLGVFATEHAEFGFLYGQQLSTLTVGGTATKDIGDMTINSYHGYFAYNFGQSNSPVRPYLLGGFGATSFGSVNYTTITGSQATINGQTKASSTWGAGVKIYPNRHVGARFGIQWTPTYIKSDATGYWCDPYWGCYLVGNAQYSNQWDLSGGITLRF